MQAEQKERACCQAVFPPAAGSFFSFLLSFDTLIFSTETSTFFRLACNNDDDDDINAFICPVPLALIHVAMWQCYQACRQVEEVARMMEGTILVTHIWPHSQNHKQCDSLKFQT
jgi:hypothetical protein